MKRMRTWTITVGSGCVLIAALVASGCDEGPIMEQADMVQGLLDQDETVNDVASEGAVYGEVVTEAAVGVVLEGMQDADEMTGKSLKWTVFNALDEDIRVVPTLRCEGLAVLSRSLELAELEIGPKGSAEIELAAAEIPIQSALGAGTVQLDFAVSTAKNSGRTVPVLSPMWYYRHSEDYQAVDVFTEAVLMEKHDGVIFEIPAGVQAKNGVIGRVLDGGEAHEVKALDSELTVGDAASGQYRVTGLSMEPGEADAEVESEASTLDYDILLLVNWCARWDGPVYTDRIGLIPIPNYNIARYTHGRLLDLDDNNTIVWSGVLDGNGCTQIWTKSNNNYQFKLGTQLTRLGRVIYVQPTESECVPNQLWHNTTVVTGSLSSGQTIWVTRSANTAQARIAVVAQRPLMYYSSREWPSAVTYIRPNSDTTGSPDGCNHPDNTSCWNTSDCGGTGRIHISTYFENPEAPGTYIDHSTYHFISTGDAAGVDH